jgi:hypothetical protein
MLIAISVEGALHLPLKDHVELELPFSSTYEHPHLLLLG